VRGETVVHGGVEVIGPLDLPSAHPLHAKTAQPISTRFCEMYKTRMPSADIAALEALIGATLQCFGYPLSGAGRPIPQRLAAQMIESDTVTNPENVAYKRWHEERRKRRREQGVWRDSDRKSILWGTN